jgi:hypothetical protein
VQPPGRPGPRAAAPIFMDLVGHFRDFQPGIVKMSAKNAIFSQES